MKQTITSVAAMLLAVLYSVGLIAATPGHAAFSSDETNPPTVFPPNTKTDCLTPARYTLWRYRWTWVHGTT
ncbi:MAG TPA: hypothetical protein DCY17_02975 [Clostridiales bacterium]|nr:hypothetical protein [Clostridiales bacterium]